MVTPRDSLDYRMLKEISKRLNFTWVLPSYIADAVTTVVGVVMAVVVMVVVVVMVQALYSVNIYFCTSSYALSIHKITVTGREMNWAGTSRETELSYIGFDMYYW